MWYGPFYVICPRASSQCVTALDVRTVASLQAKQMRLRTTYISRTVWSWHWHCNVYTLTHSLTHSLTGPLDRRRVVAPSKTCGHARSSRRRWQQCTVYRPTLYIGLSYCFLLLSIQI